MRVCSYRNPAALALSMSRKSCHVVHEGAEKRVHLKRRKGIAGVQVRTACIEFSNSCQSVHCIQKRSSGQMNYIDTVFGLLLHDAVRLNFKSEDVVEYLPLSSNLASIQQTANPICSLAIRMRIQAGIWDILWPLHPEPAPKRTPVHKLQSIASTTSSLPCHYTEYSQL